MTRPAVLRRVPLLVVSIGAFAGLLVGPPAALAQTTFVSAGASPAAIQPTVDNFRAALGNNNGNGGSLQVGRREVNWEDVPDNLSSPTGLPFNYFNATLARGLVMTSVANIGGQHQLLVSARPGNPGGTAVRFGDLNATYPTNFQAFSGTRIATARFSNVIELTFCVPGTSLPATVSGFGMVLLDVEMSATYIEFYGPDTTKLSGSTVNASSGGLSFIGFIAAPGTRIARVIVQTGTLPLTGTNVDGGGEDIVAFDDMIFGEPRSMMQGTNDFDGDGGTDFTVFRPSTGQWFIGRSGGLGPVAVQWGEPGDIPVAGDYDGDRISDVAIFRPRDGAWFIAHSSGLAPRVVIWGQNGDIPVPADYDKDGKTDIAIYRPSTGQHFLVRSSNGSQTIVPWGQPGDIPVAGRGPF